MQCNLATAQSSSLPAATVYDTARLCNSSVLPAATVHDTARLCNSSVLPAVTIHDTARLCNSLVLPTVTIHDAAGLRTVTFGGVVVQPEVVAHFVRHRGRHWPHQHVMIL